MDSQGKTIAFTLPISCHICLGKVKHPVTCSNQHVFCKICLNVWLDRSPACPTCRVPINDQNPYKEILGGTETESPGEQRWDLLRARIEISLKEYENELETQKVRNQKLENENKSLLEKLASYVGSSREENGAASGVGDFTVLNEELREMSNLYEKAKKDNSELKKTNRTLTDQNVNLVREAELLRLEVSKRSPQKFGRITVSTLQNKLEDSDKKVRQLQKALEKTDDYVNQVERKLRDCKCSESQKTMEIVREGKPEQTQESETKSSCQRNLMSSLGRDHVDSARIEKREHSHESRPNSVQKNESQHYVLPTPNHAIQHAAMRAASSRMQNGRQDPKIDSSSSSFALKNSPYAFVSPSSANLNNRGEMTSSERSHQIATSPTKRKRLNNE